MSPITRLLQQSPLRWCAALGWTAYLTVLLLQAPQQPMAPTVVLPGPPSAERELLFAAIHLMVFALLAFLWAAALASHMPLAQALLWAAVIVASYGVLTEFAQSLTPGRSPQWIDLAANFTGMLAGIWFLWQIKPGYLSGISTPQ